MKKRKQKYDIEEKELVKDNEPLISIIIPVYNVEKYIDRCLDSILNQSYKNLEIILIDDGSPDNCGKICDKYAIKDKRIKVIHKTNGGLSDARNKGIEVATGQYIGFVDSDDWIHKDMYKNLYNSITTYKADISCCKIIRVSDNNVSIPKKYDSSISVYTKDNYMKKFFKIKTQECVYYATNKLYRKNILANNQYPVGLTAEDVLGTYKALIKCQKIVEINYPYYYYYYNPESLTSSSFSAKAFDTLEIWDRVVDITRSSNQEYIDWALLNRNRINYTLLMQMALSLSFNEIENKYKLKKDKMLKELKKNYKELLKCSIPISRKITIVLIVINYKFFVFMCNFVKGVN